MFPYAFSKRRLLVGLMGLLLLVGGCGPSHWTQTEEKVRVLFIGNSYTFFNDMPEMFASLVREGGYDVEVQTVAKGGLTLADHAVSSETQKRIAEGAWNYIVLQEQSIIPAVEQRRKVEMVAAAEELVNQINAVDAQPLFFMTWGRRNGLSEVGFDDFIAMQRQLEVGYSEIAQTLDAAVVPVGLAWQQGLEEDATLNLWDSDGSHPSLEGSYLTACVFYAFIVQQSPEGLDFSAGLSIEKARTLQRIAAETVLRTE